ncbi:MAG: hypothetical protein CMA68_04090 [Euryarchaeota archaeon]|nr:hypothetical protein [Euryarchaeota archaeon]
MSDTSEMENFQRWLQTQLSLTASIEEPSERERRRLQIESAIREAISFRESLEMLADLQVSPPFVSAESSVRKISEPITPDKENISSRCPKCDSEVEHELGFCTMCGEKS